MRASEQANEVGVGEGVDDGRIGEERACEEGVDDGGIGEERTCEEEASDTQDMTGDCEDYIPEMEPEQIEMEFANEPNSEVEHFFVIVTRRTQIWWMRL